MKRVATILFTALLVQACNPSQETADSNQAPANPYFGQFNKPIHFERIDAEDITEASDSAKKIVGIMIDQLVSVEDEERTFENTMLAYDQMVNDIYKTYCITSLLGSTSPDSLVRTTAQLKRTELSQLFNEISLNEDLYGAIKSYSNTPDAAGLSGHRAKFVTETVKEFERNGFALPLEQRDQLKDILNEISAISNEFNTNIANYEDNLILSEDEMAGMDEDFKKAHLQEDGTYKVGLSYPDYLPFMKNADSEKARRELYIKYKNRAADSNLSVLGNLINKRTEMAKLLGYDTYAAYQIDELMAGNTETVWNFESGLEEKLKPKGKDDLQKMEEYKTGLGLSKEVKNWDKSYVENKMLVNEYGVDEEVVRQYFPIENVKEGLFKITQNLFGLTYKPLENASVWHEDVDAYEVYQGKELVGRFYLDLHPRSNKFNHAACFPTVTSGKTPSGYQLPAATLVCNFTAPTEDKPALMTHDEVETFFHEFGHVLHFLLTKTELVSQSSIGVARDFVEAPSQIFENWVWDYESLQLFARHYETDEVLPKALFDKMLEAKNFNSGIDNLTQVFYGTYALTLYDQFEPGGSNTTTDVTKDLYERITLFPYVQDTHFEAAFGHLNGYGAGYYGYLWSKVYAQDMFSKFEEKGILNPEVGAAYRDKVLSKGSSISETEMLKDFLGREPKQEAFIKSLGLE